MSESSRAEKISILSTRIVEAQRPIRVLNSIKWAPPLHDFLRKTGYREMPPADRAYYESQEPGFDLGAKRSELEDIARDIERDLVGDPVGELLLKIARQYTLCVGLLEERGRPAFGRISRELYGSAHDRFFDDQATVLAMANLLRAIFLRMPAEEPSPSETRNIPAEVAVATLTEKFHDYFGDTIPAVLDDGIVADAAAGSDQVKIRAGALFSRRQIDLLEVHEGWVHVGTSLNGRLQPVARWLAKGPPRCTATQEGLAVLMEIFTFRTFPLRARKINDRVLGIARAEEGANFLEVLEYFRMEGYDEEDAVTMAIRVFRGAPLDGGAPFTKDLSYCRGFVENYNFIRTAVRSGKSEMIPFLFAGKLALEDIPLIFCLHREGLVEFPRYLPPHFRDLKGLVVWMSFSSVFNQIDLTKVREHFDGLFRRFS